MSFTVEREVAEAMDWYQTHHIIEGYKKMKKLLNDDMNMDDTHEVYYEQNLSSGDFRSEVVSVRDLGERGGIRDTGARTKLAFDIAMWTRNAPKETEEGMFGVLELNPIAKLVVELPGDEHKYSHQFLRWVWYEMLFHEQFEYWVEYAEEELNRYINEVREFFGLEPTLAKTQRLEYNPLVKGYS
ncbi:MAG: hypothetical protein MUP63_00610 [Candidatus Nanohaloarchaeota archaeon QJJ-7]|nr:hypothetical protein [Candidatus Nanohaloarchaeota archaeon QJJ-7]